MKAMKGLSMKSMLGSVRGRSSRDGASQNGTTGPPLDTPEANAARGVRLFCESGGPNNTGEEVLHLPTIVEAAESSPAAAKECAQVIRKFLSKDNYSRPHVQYNGIMLVRILADNPGPTFTRNLDKKFVEAVKELLRSGRDLSVRQILVETLVNFQREKNQDEGLALLIQMWEKEQGKLEKSIGPNNPQVALGPGPNPNPGFGPYPVNAPPFDPHGQNYFSRSHNPNRGLPTQVELVSRIEEAKTSAKLLTQLVQSTPPTEFLQNDLIREFADRCQSASRSIQGYIISHNPPPDNDTMLTLIETNEQLALALSKHQRAILATRKSLVMGTENGTHSNNSPDPTASGFAPPPMPPPSFTKPPSMPARSAVGTLPQSPVSPETFSQSKPTSPQKPSVEQLEDPFKDPSSVPIPYPTDGQSPADQFQDTLGIEPYHPGFRPTQSYIGRQDSALGKTTMHAAVPATPDLEGTDKEAVISNGPMHEGDEDSYGVSPVRSKAPIYRY